MKANVPLEPKTYAQPFSGTKPNLSTFYLNLKPIFYIPLNQNLLPPSNPETTSCYLVHFAPELDLTSHQILCQVIILLFQAVDGVPELLVVPLQSEHRVFQLCLLLLVGLVVSLQLPQLLLTNLEAEHSVEEQLTVGLCLEPLGKGYAEVVEDPFEVQTEKIFLGNLKQKDFL